MARKPRKTVTQDKYDCVIRMLKSEKSIKEIAENVDLNGKTVRNLIRRLHENTPFETARVKLARTVRNRNARFSEEEQIIFNTVALNNALVQNKMQAVLTERTSRNFSQPTASRMLKKIKNNP